MASNLKKFVFWLPHDIEFNMKDIVFFGGAFDPPHLGHLAVLQFLETLSRFDEVWLVPSFSHPYEKKMISYDHRIKMCELLLTHASSKVRVSDIEKQWGQKPCYTLDVIRYAKSQDPFLNFWLVTGSDCQKEMPGWYQYEKLKNEVNFFFLPRSGFENSPFPNISSTQVRKCLVQRKGIDNLLSGEVLNYIMKENLYNQVHSTVKGKAPTSLASGEGDASPCK